MQPTLNRLHTPQSFQQEPQSVMRFCQIIEFSTDRIDEFTAHLDAWKLRTEGKRIPHRAALCRDRDAEGRYLLTVEFSSFARGLENSKRPETAEFASFLAQLSHSPLTFRNLDLLQSDNF
jgi:hypothetical protein